MSKLYTSLILFAVGFFLSFVVVKLTGVRPGASERSGALQPEVAGAAAVDSSTQSSSSGVAQASTQAPARDTAALIRKSLPSSRRVELLVNALRDGELGSLQLIRTDYLEYFEDYQGRILPALKRQGVESLLERFTEKDWEDWSRSAFSNNGQPTAARKFVDDVTATNTELGAYLETAAHLFSRLYRKTVQAKVFVVASEMQELHANAEQELEYRKNIATPAHYLLNPMLIQDPAFIELLERERCNQVTRYISASRVVSEQSLQLLASVEAPLCGANAGAAMALFLNRLSVEGSPEARETVFLDEGAQLLLAELAKRNKRVNEALAQLYAVGAVDALSEGSRGLAEEFLKRSILIKDGLPSQALVASYLSKPEPTAQTPVVSAEPAAPPAEETTTKNSLFAESKPEEPAESASSGPSFIGVLSIIVLAGLIPFALLYMFNKLRAIKTDRAAFVAQAPGTFTEDNFWDGAQTDDQVQMAAPQEHRAQVNR